LAGKKTSVRQNVFTCVNAALEKKAKNIIILSIKDLSSFADYAIICGGGSDRQVQSIAQFIEESMKKAGVLPLGIEGERDGRWILMDYNDVIVHVFYEPVREYYDIEGLWADAPRMEIAEEIKKIKSLKRGM
jgi:ribosome-associated protein